MNDQSKRPSLAHDHDDAKPNNSAVAASGGRVCEPYALVQRAPSRQNEPAAAECAL
jgi:hypothetical protein